MTDKTETGYVLITSNGLEYIRLTTIQNNRCGQSLDRDAKYYWVSEDGSYAKRDLTPEQAMQLARQIGLESELSDLISEAKNCLLVADMTGKGFDLSAPEDNKKLTNITLNWLLVKGVIEKLRQKYGVGV